MGQETAVIPRVHFPFSWTPHHLLPSTLVLLETRHGQRCEETSSLPGLQVVTAARASQPIRSSSTANCAPRSPPPRRAFTLQILWAPKAISERDHTPGPLSPSTALGTPGVQ